MSTRYEAVATVTIAGDEADHRVRAHVEVEPSRSHGWSATIDGSIEVLVDGRWVDIDDAGLDAQDRERVEDVLCELALDDDTDQCVEWGMA